LDDSKEHAIAAHAGKIAAVTCTIHESTLESGKVRLYQVMDETGEQVDCINEFCGLTSTPDDEEEEDMPPSTVQSTMTTATAKSTVAAKGGNGPNIRDGSKQSQAKFVPASSLLPANISPPRGRKICSTPQAHEKSSEIRSPVLGPPFTQPGTPFFTSTPLSSQRPKRDTNADRTLSRQSTASTIEMFSSSSQSTESTVDTTSSSSSSLSASATAAATVALLRSNNAGDDEQAILGRIENALLDMIQKCRICWVNRVVGRSHSTYKCPEKLIVKKEWEEFRCITFPKGVLCYFCLIPFGPPFYHRRAPAGSKPTPDLCDYPDALKELAFIIYKQRPLREKVFAKLGLTAPSHVHHYKQCLAAAEDGRLPAIYKIIDAYLRVQEEDALLA